MAERRMFSKAIVASARFLKMPATSQNLYFHLGMHADDDGVVEGYSILKMVGANEDDLRVLYSKGFVKILNEDLVTYIADWREQNRIRADRKKDSVYQSLLLQVEPNVELLEKAERADSVKRLSTHTDPIKDVDLCRDDDKPALLMEALQYVKYGTLKNVLLKESEYSFLKETYADYDKLINRVSVYLPNAARVYQSHFALCLKIAEEDGFIRRAPEIRSEVAEARRRQAEREAAAEQSFREEVKEYRRNIASQIAADTDISGADTGNNSQNDYTDIASFVENIKAKLR